jgi:hypothetical protein
MVEYSNSLFNANPDPDLIFLNYGGPDAAILICFRIRFRNDETGKIRIRTRSATVLSTVGYNTIKQVLRGSFTIQQNVYE